MRNKQISGGILFSFLSQFIGIGVGLAYTPIMIRILGQNEYGLYQLVQSMVNYLTLMNFGFNGAYIRYYSIAKAKNDEREIANINGMFFNIFIILAGLIVIGGAVLYANIGILGRNLSAADYTVARQLLIIMVINLALSMPNSLFVAYMSANEQFVFQKVVHIIANLLIPVLNLPLLLLGFGSVGVVSVTLLLTILRLFINVIYCVKKLHIRINSRFFDKTIFGDLLSFTFFIFLSDLVDQLNSNVDKLLLGRMRGTIAVALYSVAFNLKSHYSVLTWIVPEMYIPRVNKLVVEDANEEQTELFIRIGRINHFLVTLVISGFILCGRTFMDLWVGPEYSVSYYATIILLLAGYIPAVQTLGVNIQNAKNKHRMRSYVYLGVALLNVVVSVLLIKKWGVLGTCLGTLLAVLIGNGLFMNIYYHRNLGLNVVKFWKEILKTVPSCSIAILLGVLLLQIIRVHSWMTLLLFICCYCIVYGASLFALGLKKEERAAVLRKLKKGRG